MTNIALCLVIIFHFRTSYEDETYETIIKVKKITRYGHNYEEDDQHSCTCCSILTVYGK
jgi:hypothetical protein